MPTLENPKIRAPNCACAYGLAKHENIYPRFVLWKWGERLFLKNVLYGFVLKKFW
jgi:hypothetical protein